MRINEPVTQREFDFPADATLMSTTDLDSRITYANSSFISVAGYTEEEILGQPHNLVRHPDMPRQAFADMWDTLKSGVAWTGLVKNRRQNGDHYWVRANATPIVRSGQCVGYMSVRTKPTRQEVEAAESLYREFREGKRQGWRIFRGALVRSGWRSWMSWNQTLSVRARTWLPLILSVPALGFAAHLWGAQAQHTGAIILGAFVLQALVGYWLETQLVRPLAALGHHVKAVASGASESLQMQRIDDIGLIARSVNQLGLMFRWIVDDVASQVGTVDHASEEIATGNMDLSDRTEQAAAALEEIAASVSSVSETVHQNAKAADQAAHAAQAAAVSADGGVAVVRGMSQSIRDISDSSRKISEITSLIDSIAFQTNILALNAAVEAARAGEQGRGFAVVASEVRALATRSAAAAKEIRTLIDASSTNVAIGEEQAQSVAKAIQSIADAVAQSRVFVTEISQSSSAQSTSVAQIEEAVSHLDQTTQQNAALVEQSAAAAQSLQDQSRHLVAAVSVFHG
jgi:aerotaxis receptor